MHKPKMIPIKLDVARRLVRLLDQYQELSCVGCAGSEHEGHCPAGEAYQTRNYLTQRINNPNRNFTV